MNDRLLGLNDQLLGVEEGLTHFFESLSILRADLGAVLHADADLLDEKTELVDTVGDLAE